MNYLKQIKLPQKLDIYRMSLGFIKNKLKWDLTKEARQSKKELSALKDKYKGKKLVLLCNGPSLNHVDFDELKKSNVFTIGLNKINLLFDSTDYRPDLIVSVNKLVIEQNQLFFNNTNILTILDSSAKGKIKKRKNVNFIHSLPFQLKFAADVTGSVCQGYTVTYVALQIAYHLGFEKVALVGCDHNFATKGSSNMTVTSGKVDPNHFSSKYFSDGAKWQLPDLLGSEMHYKMAKEYYEANDREIVNCTSGGKLEIYRRMQLRDFLNE
ncbi:6-hydroxymethylpterin diphosphokinase MptE-like protein [Polaribacter septentrionalilitoris]|uniref:6-hydroxymethylpterin diphosphokinase MptE-like protein n=1 Tax=Polaribacter septentrionalilitoris TaxID=2494657 RepID=UPI00135701D6|nr:6-hydroxymethylpterin diphosphokinase MptE-like protein [Polaribacter septentrionalilitoris]